jgi:hypothetical protein
MGLTIKQKQDYAKLLYLKTTMTQKEIAEKIGVTEKTLGSWVRKGDWEVLRASYTVTKEQELRRIYQQINNLNNTINDRDEGKRYATNPEADILSKLASTARSLETETGLSAIVDTAIMFLDWLRPVDFELSNKVSDYFDGFIKERLSKF